MQLYVSGIAPNVSADFGNWLITCIRAKLIANIDSKKLVYWNQYLKESKSLKRLTNVSYTAADIIKFASMHLTCTSISGQVVIKVNPNILVPNYDRLSLLTICKMLNYGIVGIKGCNIFTKTFKHFQEHIVDYFNLYQEVKLCQ